MVDYQCKINNTSTKKIKPVNRRRNTMNFLDLGLSDKTIQAIDEFGIKEPTTVQADVIPSILQGKDVFTIAPQGCGKTFSYVFPLIDIISAKGGQNILIITPDSEQSVIVSDRLSIFNKYHEINEATIKDKDEDIDNEANVIIGSPDLLVDIVEDGKIDLSKTNILIVDDINLIKKNKQLENLEKILELLPTDKQNIVYTNRRSKETQDILDKILKAPEEFKVDKNKEQEAEITAQTTKTNSEIKPQAGTRKSNAACDPEAMELIEKYNTFNGKTPEFIKTKGLIVNID